jgi:hypothetical protein
LSIILLKDQPLARISRLEALQKKMPKPNRLLEQDASSEVSYVPVAKYDPIGSVTYKS